MARNFWIVSCLALAALATYFLLQKQPPAEPLALSPNALGSSDASASEAPLSASGKPTSPVEPEALRAEAQLDSRSNRHESVSGRLIAGRVLFPAGTPEDEQAIVVLTGRLSGEKKLWRVPLQTDGRFEITVDSSLSLVRLKLEARYLHLDKAHALGRKSPSDNLVLQPRLGMRVEGIVLLPNGTPAAELAGSKLVLKRVESSPPNGGQNLEPTFVDAAGRFELNGLVANQSLQLELEPEGYPQHEYVIGQGTPGELREVTLQLEPGLILRGSIKSEAGQPIADAWVVIESTRAGFGGKNSLAAQHARTSTDSDGNFELTVAAGPKVLKVWHSNFLGYQEDLGDLHVDRSPIEVSIVLPQLLRLAGRVQNPDGSVPDNAYVTIRAEDGSGKPMTQVAQPDGSFAFEDVPDTTFTVLAEAGSDAASTKSWSRTGNSVIDEMPADDSTPKLWAWAREVAPGDQLLLKLRPGFTLTVETSADGGDLPQECRFRFEPVDIAGFDSIGTSKWTFDLPSRDPSVYRFENLAPGAYLVNATSSQGSSNPELVNLVSSDAYTELVIRSGSSLRGSVLSPDRDPVPGASVSITYASMPSEMATRSIAPHPGMLQLLTNEEGEFAARGIHPSRIFLVARAEPWKASAKLECTLAPGQRMDELVLKLRNAGRIHGVVASEAIAASPFKTTPSVSIRHYPSSTYARIELDSNGEFSAVDLEPGTWTVEPPLFVREPEQEVEVLEGQTTEVVFGQPKSTTIEVAGRLSRSDVPLPNTHILFREVSDGFEATARSNAQGEYSLGLTQAGKYFIEIGRSREGAALFERKLPNQPLVTLDFELPAASLSGSLVPDAGTDIDDLTLYLSCLDANVDGFAKRRSLKVSMHPKPYLAQLNPDFAAQAEKEIGRFRFEHLPPGHYRLRVAAASNDLVAFVPSIRIDANSTDEQMHIPIAQPVRAVCRAYGPNRTPLQGARIRLRNADGLSVLPWYERSAMDGEFEIAAPPGEYTLHAEHGELAGTASLFLSRGVTTQAEIVLTD